MAYLENTNPVKLQRQNHRKRVNNFILFLSLAAMLFGLFWLSWIVLTILFKGLGGISLSFFTEITPPPNSDGGGLLNSIVGSLILVLGSTLIGTPLGVLAGIYLAEYDRYSKFSEFIRFINDILLSAPSIVIGLFIYSIVVVPMKSFSGLAGILALTLIQIPIIIKVTENMLVLVSDTLREAAFALGTPKSKIILNITLKASISGILTGILLGITRISGETAPLLFTSLTDQFMSIDILKPISNLPVTIYNFASQPDANLQKLAWAGIFFMTLCILLLNIFARILTRNKL